jgi:hypothetical protein
MKKFTKFFNFVFAIVITITSIVKADLTPTQLLNWNDIRDVVYAGGPSVLAGTYGGLLRSGNNGISFSTTDINIRVICLDYDANSNIVYIGTAEGLYYGAPNSSSFTKATYFGNSWIFGLGVVGEGSIIGKKRVLVSDGFTTYKSDDNGLTWSPLSGNSQYILLVNGGIINGNKVVFASNNKVYRNENNGDGAWTLMDGLPNPAYYLYDMSFSVVSSVPKLYVISSYGFGGDKVYVSSYSGGIWSAWSNILSVTSMNDFIWSLFSDDLNNVLAGTGKSGILKTNNNGVSWSTDNTGLENLHIFSIKSSLLYLFACSPGGIYYRPLPVNSSGTWTRCTITEWTRPSINWLEAHAYYQYASTHFGIFRSTDKGSNWNLSNSGLTNSDIEQTINQNNIIFAATHGGVHKSTNYGTNWTLWNNGITDSIINCFASTPSIIFAGTDSKGVFRSTNDSLVWVTAGLSNKKIRKLFVAGNFVFAATNTGIYRTSNSGAAWEAPSLSDTAINGFAVRGSSLYAVSGNNGVFVSTNNGTNWLTFNSGLTSTKINTILSHNNILYVGTRDSGLFNASAGNWESTNRNAGIFSLNITALSSDTNNIYVGDNCGLVYSGPFSSIFYIKKNNTEIPTDYKLIQNFPNPFNPSTNIKFEIPPSKSGQAKNNYVTLKIYDALGREIATLVNEQLKAGTYQVDWNGSSYASGVYYYRLTAGDFVETKKMLLVK